MRGFAFAAVLMLVGCSLTPTPTPNATVPPDFVRRLDAGSGVERRLLVYDPSGLLVNVQVPSPPAVFSHDVVWKPVADHPDSLRLGWLGGRCAVDPTLRVTKQGTQVSLAIFDGHMPALASNEVCGDVGIAYEVVLTFREPVSTFEVSATLSEDPQ